MCTNLREHDPSVTAWLQKFAAMQMIDVLVPTTDRRELLLTHYTWARTRLLPEKLRLELLAQPPPKILRIGGWVSIPDVVKTFRDALPPNHPLGSCSPSVGEWASGWRFRNFPADARGPRPG
jgi:hypothetical protein